MKHLLIGDAALFAGLLALRVVKPRLFARIISTAITLAGIGEALAAIEAEAEGVKGRIRRFLVKLRGVPGVVRAALTPHADAVPVPCRVLIAVGVAVPVIGPIDEALAALTVAALMVSEAYRAKVVRAWNLSLQVSHA